MLRDVYNGLRGVVGSIAVFPVAERFEQRDIRSKQASLAAAMALPFAERRRQSWADLVRTLQFAGTSVSYYRDLFATIGFDPERLHKDPAWLSDIPFLTKDIIREQGDRMLRDDHADFRKHICKTGGSTGPSTHISYDQTGADWSSAATRFSRALVGAHASRSQLHLAANFDETIPFRDRVRETVKCLANNRFNLTFATFASAELDRLWRQIVSIKPHLIHGHPSTLNHLAMHLEAKGIAADKCGAFAIFESSGEVLDGKQLERITRVFGCRVVNRYGLAEVGVMAYQTDAGSSSMRVLDSVAWPEIMPTEIGPEGLENQGELVVTAMTNHMMPLIRYRTGDVVVLNETCNGFELRDIIGRVHDVIALGNVPVPTHHIQDVLDRIGGVREFQVEARHERPMFRIVAESTSCKQKIELGLRTRWQDLIGIEFVGMDQLKLRGWRSKFRHLVEHGQ